MTNEKHQDPKDDVVEVCDAEPLVVTEDFDIEDIYRDHGGEG